MNEEEVIFSLHPAQLDVFTDQLLDIKSPQYNIGGFIKLKGGLNKDLFRKVVASGWKVFDAFRMSFDSDVPEPVFFLSNSEGQLTIAELDFSSSNNGESDAGQWMQDRFNTAFVLKKGAALYEQYLLKISNDEHWFFGKYHHLITDGYGFVVWVKYLAFKYNSLLSGNAHHLSFNAYADEVTKATLYKNSPAYLEDGDYWKSRIPVKPEKVLQRRYPANGQNKSGTFVATLSELQRAMLEELEEKTKIRLHHLTIAALLIYFGKTSPSSDFVFGIPVHKRGSKEARNIVGMFSGIMPFKGSFKKEVILADLLKEIAFTQKQDYRYQQYPIGDLARALQVNSSEGYLFDVTINYKLLNFELSFGNELEATIFELANDFQKNPLQLCWQDFGKQQPLQLQLDYGTEYFTKDEITLLAERIIFILEQFPAALFTPVGEIDILPQNEKKLLSTFNNNSGHFLSEKNLVELFEAQVTKTPEALALIFADEKLTYRQLNERSNQLANFITIKGVRADSLVPLSFTRSTEMIVAILAVLKSGGAYVPIDPTYPAERIAYMLDDINAPFVLACKATQQQLISINGIEIIETDAQDLLEGQSKEDLSGNISPSNLAYIIYTSGSTGRPKGVMIEHGSVVSLVKSQSESFKIDPTDTILQFSNYCFDASVEQIFLAFLNGGSLILFEEGTQLDSLLFKKLLIENQVTHLHATPSFLENLGTVDSPFLKRVIAGGDVCKAQLPARWGEQVDFYNEYGPTETTVTAIEYLDPKTKRNGIVYPIGRPLKNVHVYIVDSNLDPVPISVPGQILIGGVQVGRGYLNMPELTAEKFLPDPFSFNGRLYKTGDLGRWLPDGNVEYLARMDEQVKIRGYRIELGEIESVLHESEMVRQAVVVANDQKDGNKQLVGYIVPERVFDKEAINAYLKAKLPGYMIPSILVELEEVPLTSNGKVNKKALPAPDSSFENLDFEAPDTEMEKVLAQTWKDLFGISQISINDNFFELGGHSLNAMQLASRVHKTLNIKIDIGAIFKNPTIKELSAYLSKVEGEDVFEGIQKLPRREYYDLSHAQKRFWILNHYKDGSQAYNFSGAYTIEGLFNKVAFSQAVEQVIERHEILRTVFVEVDGEPRQKVLSAQELGFKIEEISLHQDADLSSIVTEMKKAELERNYDLATGPLFRVKLFSQSAIENIVLFSIHHIISDGWSKGILIDELLGLYKAYSSGTEPGLPVLAIQYKDYAAWHSSVIPRQESYWEKMLEGDVPVLDFPADFERPEVLSFLGSSLKSIVSEALTLKLKQTAVDQNMSLNNLLFSLYALLISQYCEQDQIVIGSLASGRSHMDVENLIGAFINFLPIKFSVNKDSSLHDFLQTCNDVLVESYKNQDYPFDLMVDRLIKRRDFSRNPFFDTMVNFHSEKRMENQQGVIESDDVDNSEIKLKPFDIKEDDPYQSVLDFKLDIEPTQDSLDLHLSYNAKLYSRERMHTFIDNFIGLLGAVSSRDDGTLADYDTIGSEKSGLKNKVKGDVQSSIELQVNICASFVAEPIQEYLDYWNKELGLGINISFAPYNQLFQQLLDSQSLINTNTGLNVLFIRVEDWIRDKKDSPAEEQVNFLTSMYDQLVSTLIEVNRSSEALFLVAIIPVYPADSHQTDIIQHIQKLNKELSSQIAVLSRMALLDIDKIKRLYDVDEIFDPKSDEIGHMPFTQECYAAIGTYLARKIRAFKAPSYKVIALDCDNTLWKGVCGELGAMNVMIDENFSALQQFILEKYKEGFLIVLCSKNNEEDVWEVFDNHPGMKLRKEHIVAHRINWQLKSDNLLSISRELNLGLDSFIFIDDSGFEVEQMQQACPEILSIQLPDQPEEIPAVLGHTWAFDTFHITKDDEERNKRYRTERDRNLEQSKYDSLSDFLESLVIKVNVRSIKSDDFERAFQLIMRTNQFNLNGIRKSHDEISKILSRENGYNRIIEVSDRFGDYGIVGLVFASVVSKELVVESFLLSCRVLGRNVEDFVISEIQNYCLSNQLRTIRLQFRPTLKNKPFEEFLARAEWLKDTETETYSRYVPLTNEINS